METNICDNNRCTYHRPLQDKYAGNQYVETVEDGEVVRVERHMYRPRSGGQEFFLCDVCHAAAQMVTGKACL